MKSFFPSYFKRSIKTATEFDSHQTFPPILSEYFACQKNSLNNQRKKKKNGKRGKFLNFLLQKIFQKWNWAAEVKRGFRFDSSVRKPENVGSCSDRFNTSRSAVRLDAKTLKRICPFKPKRNLCFFFWIETHLLIFWRLLNFQSERWKGKYNVKANWATETQRNKI